MWLYGSGFPKSQNLGNAVDKKNGIDNRTGNIIQGMGSNNTESMNNHKYVTQNYKKQYEERKATNKWQGWGTCLKPSYEPIIVARKPFKGSLVDNVIEYGVGGINIDECRISTNGELIDNHKTAGTPFMRKAEDYKQLDRTKSTDGRFPANTILTYDETDYEEVCGGFPDTKGNGNIRKNKNNGKGYNCYSNYGDCETRGYEDSGSAARYFMNCKYNKKDDETWKK